jgi:hypothetical protein
MTTQERLATAQWIFERNLGWISSADAKVAVLATIDVAMFGGLAAAFALPTSTPNNYTWCAIGVACLFLIFSLVAAFAVLRPNTTPGRHAIGPSAPQQMPPNSLVFFGEVSKQTCAEYTYALETASAADLLKDWARQIHRNAEIAAVKHRRLKLAMTGTFLALVPWSYSIVALVAKANGSLLKVFN